MKLGIVIATYRRKDGTTPTYLTRALESIKNQVHQDYKVFLIGDNYEDDVEFTALAKSIIPQDNLYYENLSVAVERVRYPQGGIELWRCGGANAFNHGVSKCYEEGITYICKLDHDDYWSEDHLSCINNVIESTEGRAAVVYTCGTYFNSHLPRVSLDGQVVEDLPKPGQAIHSTSCIDYSKVYLKYRDTAYEVGIPDAGDADLLKRLEVEVQLNNLKSYLVRKLTCYHPEENH
jgi:glycosyltransferase involved in cell wall biosynthesis